MDQALTLSNDSLTTAGVLLLTIVAVQSGGLYLLSLVRGKQPSTDFQMAFSRAGHAHAGVLVILSLLAQIYVDASGATGLTETLARLAIPWAAILMPAGFFFSSAGRDVTRPNRWIVLLYIGAVSLAVGVVSLGIALLTA